MINRENLAGMSTWAGFCGIMYIILGALNAIVGVFAFIIGAIPGILMILMGIKLRAAKTQIDLLQMQPEGTDTAVSLNAIFYEMKGFLQMQGIIFILALIFMLIGLLIMMFVGIGALSFLHALS
ncbi:MAG TPA: DUF5362 family protein [Syntrophomonadaceae bacterium]|nr:DUF5362 family protein [Syntrophomonadaceae bacterium]